MEKKIDIQSLIKIANKALQHKPSKEDRKALLLIRNELKKINEEGFNAIDRTTINSKQEIMSYVMLLIRIAGVVLDVAHWKDLIP